MAVQVIKATKGPPGSGQREGSMLEDRIRVAAYCRVSTDSEEQETSYEAQCRHYTNLISSTPGWTLAGIYADEGITGTNTKKRDRFNRMLADCEEGLIDMVISKSISRWARNTVDFLKSTRRLKELGIPVLFEKENINTMDNQGELLITIMSSLAQAESESISQNVRLGIQFLFQQGKGRINTAQFLGFAKSEDGWSLVIVPEEAVVVRRIYREYLDGSSPAMIAAGLMADKIPTPTGKETWYQSTIVSILENEKYCGDLLMQKYFTKDVMSHKIMKNEGQLRQYFVEDAHEPIVPKQVYRQVQGEMQRRSLLKNDPSKIRYGAKQALTGRLICGHCGRALKRYNNPNPLRSDWRCRKRAYDKRTTSREIEGQCPCRRVTDREAKQAVIEAFNRLPSLRDELIRMEGALWKGSICYMDAELERLDGQLERIRERMESLKEEADGDQVNYLQGEMTCLEGERSGLLFDRAEAANRDVQIRLLLELVDGMTGKKAGEPANFDSPACYDYDEFFCRTRRAPDEGVLGGDGSLIGFDDDMIIRYMDRMVILDDAYQVFFKCGQMVRIGLHG